MTLEIKEINGTITCLEGLRIGGSKDLVSPGETDNPIIKETFSGLPYIPGSSLKGKIRCLLELKESKQAVCICGTCYICHLFGCGKPSNTRTMSRLIFRDCSLTEESKKLLEEAGITSETKTEVVIDRTKGTAAHPRSVERIPAGVSFKFNLSMRVFAGDNEKTHYEKLAEGIDLLEKDYLGGCGTRGYGKVKFTSIDGKMPLSEYLRKMAKEVGNENLLSQD